MSEEIDKILNKVMEESDEVMRELRTDILHDGTACVKIEGGKIVRISREDIPDEIWQKMWGKMGEHSPDLPSKRGVTGVTHGTLPVDVWQPTMELGWKKNPDMFAFIGFGRHGYTPPPKILMQRWVSNTGKQEWREVGMINE